MIIFLLLIFFITQLSSVKIEVKTTHGKLIGTPSLLLPNVTEFLGVPYAMPPVGDLRFKKPEYLPYNYYGKGLNVHSYAKACIQIVKNINFQGFYGWQPREDKMSEDCLQLNMWVPDKPTGAVIVFLFGGQYMYGSSSLRFYDGNYLADRTGAIVINLNYRLGVFGFAYFHPERDDGIPGNLGLLDQQVGLEWIRENIRYFGGDPKKVTLFGQGSGAAMATAHMFSCRSSRLFKRLIASSGTIINKWAVTKSYFVRDNFEKLIKEVKCNTGNYRNQIKCMQNIDARELAFKASLINNANQFYSQSAFMPIDEDDVFFFDNVTTLYKKRYFTKQNVDVLIGRTEDEASYFMPLLLNSSIYNCRLDYKMPMTSPVNQCKMTSMNYNYAINLIKHENRLTKQAVPIIKKLYEKPQERDFRDRIVRALSDFNFHCEANEFANVLHKRGLGNVYYYNFKKRSPSNPWPEWMGAMHRYDMLYIFGHPFTYPLYYKDDILENEEKYSEKIMNIIGGFANYGNITREIDNLEQTYITDKEYKDKFEIGQYSSKKFDKNGVCSDVEFIRKKYKL